MSPVGHSLVGLAFAALAIPPTPRKSSMIACSIAFVALASLPDWPLPHWGHDRYDISHSVFVNGLLIAVVFGMWQILPKMRLALPRRTMLLAAAAWASHLLLDTFYNHGRGLAIYWPISDARLSLSLPWFSTIDLSESLFSQHNASVFKTELVAYSPVLMGSLVMRRLLCSRGRDRHSHDNKNA